MTTRGRFLGASAFVLALTLIVAAAGRYASAQQPEQQRPVFRTGTSLVRVDAYPSKDGKIIEGLTAEDFEVFEDGVLQKIESFQFVEYGRNIPLEERRDPNSQRDGFNLAADPSYRVFVIYLDNLHVDFKGSHAIRLPLINFMNRVLGTRDLFGVLTTVQSVDELMLGQKTQFIEEQLTKYWDWGSGARVLEDEADIVIRVCYGDGAIGDELVRRRQTAEVMDDLEGIMFKLGSIREERKNILLVSDGFATPGRADWLQNATKPMKPRVGVTDAGKLTMGRTRAGEIDPRQCEEAMRLAQVDFRERMRNLLQIARESNVTFYAIKPAGLTVFHDSASSDTLLTLANNTDGIAIVNTNDLKGGAMRIGDDLSGSYILAYYPTNTKPDGRIRKITVRLKNSGEPVRARREYRAPTEEEMASMRAAVAAADVPVAPSPVDTALAELKRIRPSAAFHTRGAVVGDELVITTEVRAPEVEAGRWKQGGEVQVMVSGPGGDLMTTARGKLDPGARAAVVRIPLKAAPGPFNAAIRVRSATDGNAEDGVTVARPTGLLGDPMIYRLSTPITPRPAASVEFRRTERIQVRWPVAGAIDSREARILGRDGVPLELAVNMRELEEAGAKFIVADLNLAPLTAGEYIIEARASGASESDSVHLAIRVGR
jgi:VWFA-related protein